MSGKRRRSETSWDMKEEKMPPKWLNSESKDHGRLSWKGNRNLPKDDDISRDRHDGEYSTRLPYRGRDDRSRSPSRSSRERESARARSRSPFRHKSKTPNNSRLSSRPCKDSWSHRPNYSRYSDAKIQCKFFAAGNCNRDDCRFSHDKNRVSHDLRHANDASSDFHLSEKKKPWDGPSWADAETGGVDKIQGNTCSSDKKTSSWDDVSNPGLENKSMSWNGPLCDVRDGNEMKKWDEKADFSHQQHNVVNDSPTHLNNGNILSEETRTQQILAFGKGQVDNGKSPKKQNNCEQEEKSFNHAKLEEGNIGNYEKRMRQCRSPNRSRSRDRETNDHVRSNSRPYKGRHSRGDYSRYSHNNRNSRNHYDDDDDDQIQSNRISNIQCKFFSAGNCQRDDCKFSHDLRNHDRRPHDENNNMMWPDHDHDHNHADADEDLNASEKKRAWDGPSWDDEDKKRSSTDDVSNRNLDDKNRSWNDVVDAKSLNNVDEKTKPWVQMDDEKGCEKNDCFLPQNDNVVNDSSTHLNNSNVLSEKGNIGNLANGVDYLKSLPNSTHKQDTGPKEGNIGNGKTPQKKHQQEGKAKKEEESEKVKEGNGMRQFRIGLVEFIKEILNPKWKEGKMTRDVYKTVVRKVVEKITSSIQEIQIPTTQAKIELYLTHSKPKIMKLVEAYVEKLVKT